MYFISFLNDLGIIPNKNTNLENNKSLTQGQEYMDYSRMYSREITPKLERLQITHLSDIGIHSIVEEMDKMKPSSQHIIAPSDTLSLLEKKFNRVLDKYNSTYKLVVQELIKHTNTKHVISNGIAELNIEPTLWNNLATLNKELIRLATKINNEISKLYVEDAVLKHKISEEQKKVNGYITNLNNDYKHITKLTGNDMTALASDSQLQKTSNYIRYNLWAVIFIILILLVFTGITNVIFIISIGVIFYIISNIIYRHYT